MYKNMNTLKIVLKGLVIFITLCGLISCSTTSGSTMNVSPNANFSNYRFAILTGLQNSYLTEKYAVDIQNVLALNGINVISESRMGALDNNQKSRLILINVGASYGAGQNSSCSLIMSDYLTGNVLMSIRRTAFVSIDKIMRDVINDMKEALNKR